MSRPPDGKAPAARISTSGSFGFVESTDEDFDAEKTMVVDPDDAPTADYDPRAHAPTPAGGSAAASALDASRSKPMSSPPPTDLTQPEIPSAPQAPSFDASGIPSPRQSELGRRRSSRRTIKIDDQGRAKSDGPTAERSPRPSDAGHGGPEPLMGADFNEAEEITIVQALRIISIGSDPPPPITTAIATWPPPARMSFDDDAIESGWTPAAGVVAVKPMPIDSSASEAPIIEMKVEPGGLDISGPISEIPIAGGDEILEEIEPDAMPFTTPASQPKRPPPPPPKNRDAKAESKPEPKAEPKTETKPEARPTTDPPKGKPWWDDIFSDEYIRTHERLDGRTIEREVDFIEESLGMEKHAVVLDLCCGFGDHAVELAGRGYNVVGFDYSKGMLKHAEQKVRSKLKAQPAFTPPSLVQGDMRELDYEEAFDGVYCWGTSLGYFDEEKNLAVLRKVHRALRQGGMFLIEVINRDYVAPRSPSLVWFEGKQCVCMDDMYIDFISSRMRVKRTAMFEGGLSRELDYSIRIYTLHELGRMLHEVGFKVIEVTGHTAHPGVFFGTESPRLIILAERS